MYRSRKVFILLAIVGIFGSFANATAVQPPPSTLSMVLNGEAINFPGPSVVGSAFGDIEFLPSPFLESKVDGAGSALTSLTYYFVVNGYALDQPVIVDIFATLSYEIMNQSQQSQSTWGLSPQITGLSEDANQGQ